MLKKEERVCRDIPLTIISPDNRDPRGVFFLIHGHIGNRKDATIVRFAEELAHRGYISVALDSYRHGDRLQEPYLSMDGTAIAKAMVSVVEQTCLDIVTVYQDLFSSQRLQVGVLGTSMGGHIAYLLPGVMPETTISIALIGAPDVLRHYLRSKAWLGDEIEPLFQDRRIPMMADPSWYRTRHLLQINGNKDDIVRYENALDFHGELPTADSVEHWFVLESCGHEITESMHRILQEFLDQIDAKSGATYHVHP
jgi:esterase/lipase